MTALKPIENRRVRAVASERYPLNKQCASPMSDAGVPADDPHHIFPRSQIGGDSWFVAIYEDVQLEETINGKKWPAVGPHTTIPHVTGLSREQHERVERHEAWIKLEDGVFNWYERVQGDPRHDAEGREWPGEEGWQLVGPLNPQPGSVEGKPKRRKFSGAVKRKRVNWQVAVPKDHEDGAGVLDDGFADAYAVVAKAEELEPMEARTPYVCLADVFEWVRQQA